jgi:hypothetical protein
MFEEGPPVFTLLRIRDMFLVEGYHGAIAMVNDPDLDD